MFSPIFTRDCHWFRLEPYDSSPRSHKLFTILYVQVTVHRDNLRINNQQDASSIQNFILLRNFTCFGIFCAHHQELSAAHVATGMFHAGHVAAAAATCKLITPDDGHRRCPKHVEFWILDASFFNAFRTVHHSINLYQSPT